MSEAQLTLVPSTPSRFTIDPGTRQIGRAGIAAARELLRAAAVPAVPTASGMPTAATGRRVDAVSQAA